MCLNAEADRVEWLLYASQILQSECQLSQSDARRIALTIFDGPEIGKKKLLSGLLEGLEP